MIDEILYKLGDDPEFYEYNEALECEIENEKDALGAAGCAEQLARDIYAQSCGDHPFPIMLQIYTIDKKLIASCEVSIEMEPYFHASFKMPQS